MHDAAFIADAKVLHTPQSGLESAFCITIYNEKLIRLQRTLSSVIASLANKVHCGETADDRFCLCLIVDGVDKMDPELLAWLDQAGLMDARCTIEIEGCATYSSSRRIADLARHLEPGSIPPVAPEQEIGFILCLKHENRGKLHSHAIFFRTLCSALDPAFCIQVDVGTVVAEDAYPRLIHHMAQDPGIGAIAPCITTTPPDDESLFISTWQHVDFVVQKAMFWPFEVASGYLSVIPGQFCILRRAALLPHNPDMADADAEEHSPIGAYLRGLSTQDPLEKLMFLAEDRVIGSEIVLREDSRWHLEYCPETRAMTDACLTVPELMRQRRRWSNSALACRLWMIGQILEFLVRADRTPLSKLRFVAAMLGQSMLMIREFASPAITLSTIIAFAAMGRHLAATQVGGWQILLNLSFAGIVIACVLPKYFKTRRVSQASAVARGLLGFVMAGVLSMMFVLTAPTGAALALGIVPGILALVATLLVFRLRVGRILMMLGVYIIVDAVMAPLVSAYSIWKLNDVSWGTKGLTSNVQDATLAQRMKRFRFFGILAWIAINGGLIAIALSVSGITSNLLNPVFELICLLNLIVNTIVLFRLVRLTFQEARWKSAGVRFNAGRVRGAPIPGLREASMVTDSPEGAPAARIVDEVPAAISA